MHAVRAEGLATFLVTGIYFLREAPERAIGTDRRARKWGLDTGKEDPCRDSELPWDDHPGVTDPLATGDDRLRSWKIY